MQEQSTIDPANPLQQALAAANDLLISTLALGDIASTDDADLLQQIAAYRSSIQQIEHGLQQSRQQSQLQFHQQQPDSQQDRTAAHGQAPDESMPKSDTEAPVDTVSDQTVYGIGMQWRRCKNCHQRYGTSAAEQRLQAGQC
eukprot:GHRR01019913.1.p1 GENE.GHRR01019913.1~~GHRR01019913.1.p1  ORF type:complete len:142 (+),score=34.85 GHRR01019913.1:192-617(+)